jgi:hypothetical protein
MPQASTHQHERRTNVKNADPKVAAYWARRWREPRAIKIVSK